MALRKRRAGLHAKTILELGQQVSAPRGPRIEGIEWNDDRVLRMMKMESHMGIMRREDALLLMRPPKAVWMRWE